MRSYIKNHHSDDKRNVRAKTEVMFQKFLSEIGYFNDFPITRAKHHDTSKEFDSPMRRQEEAVA